MKNLFHLSTFLSTSFFLLVLILQPNINLFAQNLVPNPSFEYYTECPCQLDTSNGQISIPDNQITKAFPWSGPGFSTDYFNSCANDLFSWCGVPNGRGQNARSGQAFSSITTYCLEFDTREYLQVPLTEILNLNSIYHIQLFLKLDYKFSARASNNLGFLFTNSPFETPNLPPNVAPYDPQTLLFGNPILNDTSEWFMVEALYKAVGNESVFTFGNFENNANTQTQQVDSNYNSFWVYYYIDDVLVEEITQPFWQYHDTTVYYGDSVLIGPALTGLDIDWYTDNLDFISNAPGIYVTPPTSRDYIAKETFNGAETEHVVHVTVIGGAGLEENELQNVRVFPNPSQSEVFVKLTDADFNRLSLKVTDANGKIVYSNPSLVVENGLASFNLNVNNGLYLVHLTNTITNETTIKKLVIQK
jgi:hypothetical protein